MNSSAARVLVIDLGSTYFKCAVIEVEEGSSCIVRRAMKCRVNQATWEPHEATRRFQAAISGLVYEAQDFAASTGLVAVSLAGVREGVAVSSSNGELLRAVSNAEAISRQALHGSRWLTEIVAELRLREAVVTSLQGWLAFALTGRLAVTECELQAWNIWASDVSFERLPVCPDLVCLPPIVPVGVELGRSPLLGGLPVVLAGTDEYASHYGVGLGGKVMAELGTGTYWSLSRVSSPPYNNPPAHVRVLRAVPPYPEIASYVGYRWGEYLYDLQGGRQPDLPPVLPSWSRSHFVDELCRGNCRSLSRAIELICEDLVEAAATLCIGSDAVRSQLAVHGGGAMRRAARAVVSAAGWRPIYLELDPTLTGSALVAVGGNPNRN